MMVLLWWGTFAFILIRYTQTADPLVDDIVNHPAWSILDTFECGESAADRIIGGKTASLGQLPWIVRLGYTGVFGDIDWMCGGALLTDRLVITAAHCVNEDELYNLTHVRLGEYDINKDPDCVMDVCAPPVQDIRVKGFVSHECFNIPEFHNDLAIVELTEPAKLNDYVAPICLPRNAEQLSSMVIGDSVVVAGWGKTNMTTEEKADKLQYVYLPILDSKYCSVFNKRFNWTEGAICAGGEKNKDACAGDSGGPLTRVFDTPEGPKHVLVGVVSFGPAICGTGNLPGIYVSVSHFLKWILGHIDGSYVPTRKMQTNNSSITASSVATTCTEMISETIPITQIETKDPTHKINEISKTFDVTNATTNSAIHSTKEPKDEISKNAHTKKAHRRIRTTNKTPTFLQELKHCLKSLTLNRELTDSFMSRDIRDNRIEARQSQIEQVKNSLSKLVRALLRDKNEFEVMKLISEACKILSTRSLHNVERFHQNNWLNYRYLSRNWSSRGMHNLPIAGI